MRKEAKGAITVLLSLILLMVLSLFFGLLESARMQTARAQLLVNADLGVFSLFAEYDRNLLEDYEVFFFDAGNRKGLQGADPRRSRYTNHKWGERGLPRCRKYSYPRENHRFDFGDLKPYQE